MSRSRIEILDAVLGSCSVEYDDFTRTFSQLDTKAQNTASMGNIFLVAALFLVQRDAALKAAIASAPILLWLLILGISGLLCSLISCVIAMWLRRVGPPADAESFLLMSEELLHAYPSGIDDHITENFIRDQIQVWSGTLKQASAVVRSKARWVVTGQSFLIAAMVLVSISLLIIIGRS